MSRRPVRVGIVILPQGRWEIDRERWQRAEAFGFDHAWTYDHLAWRELADEPWYATVPTLVAAATVTQRIRLGTWVASPNFRHPVPFAKELMSLDDVSNGRFVLGVGAGGTDVDAVVLGQPPMAPRERVERFAEFVTLLDLLLTHDHTTWQGKHYAAVDARMLPGCVQQPRLPFVVAANGPRAMRVAATYGQGWATTGSTPKSDGEPAWWRGVADLVRRFEEVCAATGRDPAGVERYLSVDAAPTYALSSVDAFEQAVGRAGDLGFTDVVVHWPRSDTYYAGDEAILDDIARLLPGAAGRI